MAIVVPIASKWDPTGVKTAARDLDRFGDQTRNAFTKVDDAVSKTVGKLGLLAGAAATAAAYGFARFAVGAVQAAEEAAIADARLEAIATSMGLFGDATSQVTGRIGQFADKLELATGVDGDLIKSMQAQLLTFESVGRTADETGSIFDRATAAALDMQAANIGGGEAAIALGKALEDPIRGVTALRKSGVTFTEDQRDLIETLVESGRTLEAQDLILKTVERQVGGTAEATMTASKRMRVAFEQLKEKVGQALLPALDRLSTFISTDLIPRFQAWWEIHGPAVTKAVEDLTNGFINLAIQYGPTIVQFAIDLATEARNLARDVKNWWAEQETLQGWLDTFGTWLSENPDKVVNLAAALLAVYAALKLLAIISGFVAALQAIAAWGSAAAGAIGSVAGAIAGAGGFIAALGGVVGLIAGLIIGTDRLVAGWQTLSDLVGSVIGKILYGGGFSLGDLLPGPGSLLPSTPGGGFLPFADGGIVTGPTLGLIGEAGPEAVIPLDQLGQMGGGVTINVSGAIDPVGVADQIHRILQQRGYRNGVL